MWVSHSRSFWGRQGSAIFFSGTWHRTAAPEHPTSTGTTRPGHVPPFTAPQSTEVLPVVAQRLSRDLRAEEKSGASACKRKQSICLQWG